TLGPEKRPVYGGGGITPDIFISFDTTTFSRAITLLYVRNTLDRFIYTYYIQHLPAFGGYSGAADFNARFHDEGDLYKALTAYATRDSVDLSTVAAKDRSVLEHRLKAMLGRQIWGTEGYVEVSNSYDSAFAKALEVVGK
ncbi:MAG TPA: hypothetical protein VN616_15445, partial [Puia sp.]|nr:hypothetical protein [Puia sp.]